MDNLLNLIIENFHITTSDAQIIRLVPLTHNIELTEAVADKYHYTINVTPTYKKNFKKLMTSGLTKSVKQQVLDRIELATKALETGTERSLPSNLEFHEWARSDRSKGYIYGDFHVTGSLLVVWMKYLNKPVVDLIDIGSHPGTRSI